MDNLPPKTNAEIERDQAKTFDGWSPREKMLALRTLYILCDSYIADLPWKISMALALEIEKKKRGLI
jgi:hypothetical protein